MILLYFKGWQFIFTIDEAIQKVKDMLINGKVEISRFSLTGFTPQLQVGEFAIERNILDKEGCYVFIRGTESTMTLDHRPSDWYNRVPFHTGFIDINTPIVDAKVNNIHNLEQKLNLILSDMELYRDVYGTWGHEIIDTGIFIEKEAIIENINIDISPQSWQMILMAS
jgi:hypothetical protein